MALRALPVHFGKSLTSKKTRLGASSSLSSSSSSSSYAFSSAAVKATESELLESRSCQNATDERLISFAQRCTTNVTSKKKRKRAMTSASKAARSFSDYYRSLYGSERWDGSGADGLCHALMDGPTCHAALVNRLHEAIAITRDQSNNKGKNENATMKRIPWVHTKTNLDVAVIDEGMGRLPTPTFCPSSSLLNYYCLDPASLLPVIALDLPLSVSSHQASAKVLDMCAAPGGKTLAILQSLFGGAAHLSHVSPYSKEENQQHVIVANEVSRNRRTRLENVLADYVPLPIQRSSLVITGIDGTMFGSASIDPQRGLHFSSESDITPIPEEDDGYTHILCDVPCSGERHALKTSSSLAKWNAGSSRHLQKKQLSLLKAAVSACRPGGRIVYSTCSINSNENDVVVEKLLNKRGDHVEVLCDTLTDFDIGESTKYGKMFLPDRKSCRGMGPMYVCTMRKKSVG
eukprot:CAMPEP_0197721360 /NCGR_PEP_ID=MMETSP1434-20131217/4433_1 /TAXON_ID=265543 /ORGANISM="Minutocellus polymorphus, Strain CCMP3303" /LENGTH=460 /DNA_ID=CAMNT_0043306353 /DNA_START=122 /DNA_END=1504 /DNA_ORIENTATION=+